MFFYFYVKIKIGESMKRIVKILLLIIITFALVKVNAKELTEEQINLFGDLILSLIHI